VSAPPGDLSTVGAVMARVADRANPMLVRHVRQQLRSRAFLSSYSATLTIAFVAAALVASDGGGDGRSRGLVAILAMVWTFAVWIFEPISAFRALSLERDEDTWDMIRLTGMSPRRLLVGLLKASTVQGMLYASAIAPFMVMAYLLRGIDLLAVLLAVLFIGVGGVAASATALLAASTGVTKGLRALLGAGLVFGAFAVWFPMAVFWADGLDDIARLWGGAWAVVLVSAIAAIVWTVGSVVLGAASLKSLVENRSTGPRALAAFALASLAAGLVLLPDVDTYDAAIGFGIFGGFIVVAVGFFALTEDWALSPRQRRWTREARPWQLPLVMGPGAARGRLWFVFLALVMLAAGVAGDLADVGGRGRGRAYIGWLQACYAAVFFGAGDAVARSAMFSGVTTARGRRVFLVGLVVGVSVLASLLAAADGYRSGFWMASPLTGFFQFLENPRDHEVALAGWSALGAVALLVLLVGGLGRRDEAVTSRAPAVGEQDAVAAAAVGGPGSMAAPPSED
jgi:hypothetical protein